ncbi:hypothetical protein M5K25_025407 [Dendrobium thyrsiflorum]|uniref:Reverse transcriptase zinc-binding domain-containing protein n=1 Tax=Dendrobium thyrsiflorum TaxID=117978 RepID=A0ABD0U3Z8_DENTH
MSLPRLAAWNVRGFNSPDKVRLDLICVLENRIHDGCFQDPWFRLHHCVYDNEASCNNFDLSQSGRIWVKWNPSKIHFSPSSTSSQMISGDVHYGRDSFFMSVIYASNSQHDRALLWNELKEIRPSSNMPWVILGDFNCCRYPSDKSGGIPLTASQTWDLNSLIFDLGLMDLASKGLNFTWFNQRAQDPIHLKLDRMLINEIWLEHFPTSFYEVASPSCSDHSHIILQSSQQIKSMHRFYNSSTLLSDFLFGKYGTPWTPARGIVSPLWKGICKVAEEISGRLLFAYTTNCKIALLWDPWINGSSLSSLYGISCDSIPFHATVSDFVIEGNWNFPADLNVELVNTLNCLPIPPVAVNCISWKDHQASFSVYIREFYKGDVQVTWFKEVWHKHFALKFSLYAWLALNRGLKTADILSIRHILIESSCFLCYSQPESIEHLLFECDYAYSVLINLIPLLGSFLLRPRLAQVLNFLGESPLLGKAHKHLYLLTTCCASYFLWRERNERRFNSNFRSSSTICHTIKSAVEIKVSKWKIWAGKGVNWL